MPEISSLPALPAVVAAAPTAGVAGVAPAAALAPGEGFLATLKTALAGLATAALPQMLTGTQSTLPAAVQTDPPTPDDASKDDVSKAVMPEVLAALGFLPVPPVLQPQPETKAAPAQAGGPAPVASPLLSTPQITPAPPAAAPSSAPAPTEGAPSSAPAPTDAAPSSAPERATAAPDQHAQLDQKALQDLPKDTNVVPPVNVALHELRPHTAPRERAKVEAGESRHIEAARAPQVDTSVVTAPQHASAQQHFGGDAQFDTSAQDQHAPTTTAEISTADPDSPEPRIEAAAAGITTTAPIANAAQSLPTHVRPSEVVNQIAHQADLYKLPGGKGVRIQLHPEDLGGVDVTLRYSSTGGIQLHINVEHASTGALVQAGWTDLRDALANQGITPDRLVMSVSSPTSASGADFSSNGGSRPDQGLASFTQNGNGQGGQRQDGNEPQRVSRVWFDEPETAEPTGAVASDARIDYRA